MPLTPKNRKEEWLEGLIEHSTTLTPKNRPEEWMLGLIEGSTTLTPKNRCEEWLKEIIDASGGGSGATLIASEEYEVNTSSTTETLIAQIPCGSEVLNAEKMVFVEVRDKEGKRNGYFYGSSTLLVSQPTAGNSFVYKYNNDEVSTYKGSYGVYAKSILSSGKVEIYSKYHATYSLTINGTFTVHIYLMDFPDGSPYL